VRTSRRRGGVAAQGVDAIDVGASGVELGAAFGWRGGPKGIWLRPISRNCGIWPRPISRNRGIWPRLQLNAISPRER
jgi:hypothetical protein